MTQILIEDRKEIFISSADQLIIGPGSPKTVSWTSKERIAQYDKPAVIISITEPGEDLPTFVNPLDVLSLRFHDIPNECSIDDLDSTYRQIDWHDARRILEFEYRYKNMDIMIHCHAGVSRSKAVALYLYRYCNRILDVSYPCTNKGPMSSYNGHVYRQLQITHLDLTTSNGKVTKLAKV